MSRVGIVNMRAAAKALGGEVVSGAISCPGPAHSPRDRSLRVYPDWQSSTGFRVHSLAGDDWRACQDHVCSLLGIGGWRPQGQLASPPMKPRRTASVDADPNTAIALSIWDTTLPLLGTVAEHYLIRRIGRTISWPRELRFHPSCPRGGDRFPALVALLRDISTNTPKAIQRIFLLPDGSDRLRDAMGKATLGSAKHAVLKLSPDEDVTQALGIAEGCEKGLSLLAAGFAPLWVTCGTSGITSFPILPGIQCLSIFADNDGPGQTAAIDCARRWSSSGIRARVIMPRAKGADWSDVLEAA